MVSLPVIKFMFRESFKVLEETLLLKPVYEVWDMASISSFTSGLPDLSGALIFFSLRDREDLIQIATLMKLVKKVSRECILKVVVVNFSSNKNFERALAKLGIQDVIDPFVTTKVLKFKLDFWMKSLNAHLINHPQKSTKSNEPSQPIERKDPDSNEVKWQTPLDLEDDVWIIRNDSDCKKVLSRWLVKVMGPSPYVGQWVEKGKNLWQFVFKETEKDVYLSGSGEWYFTGELKPDFIWKENLWMVTGDSFDLFFKRGEEVFSRLSCKQGFSACRNSIFAKTKEGIILESFDKELVFKKEAKKLGLLTGDIDTDKIISGPLTGKDGLSNNLGGPLAGATQASGSNGGNLSGTVLPFPKSTSLVDREMEEITSDALVTVTVTHNKVLVSCRLDDYFDDTIFLSTLMTGIKSNTKVTLEMVFRYLNRETKLSLEGVTLETESDDEGQTFFVVKIAQDKIPSMDRFMSLYDLRQENINKFLNQVKGL